MVSGFDRDGILAGSHERLHVERPAVLPARSAPNLRTVNEQDKLVVAGNMDFSGQQVEILLKGATEVARLGRSRLDWVSLVEPDPVGTRNHLGRRVVWRRKVHPGEDC